MDKTSGFGIGELGQTPESTPYDDMVAAEIQSRNKMGIAKKIVEIVRVILKNNILHTETEQGERTGFEMVDLRTNRVTNFKTLDEMINFVKIYCCGSRGEQLSLHAPGYAVGDCYPDQMNSRYILTWRRALKLPEPETHCNECGSGDIRRGRCTVCGETEMIETSWYSYEDHREFLAYE